MYDMYDESNDDHNILQEEHDYDGQGVAGKKKTSALNPFDAFSLPGGLLHPLKSKLLKKGNGGLLPSPMEHLSKDPCGKWKIEKDNQRAALNVKEFYLENKQQSEKEKKKKKGKCGWWGRRGRRVAKKRLEQEISEKSQPPKKKKTRQDRDYGRKSKWDYLDYDKANPFPTLDLSAKVNNLVLIQKLTKFSFTA